MRSSDHLPTALATGCHVEPFQLMTDAQILVGARPAMSCSLKTASAETYTSSANSMLMGTHEVPSQRATKLLSWPPSDVNAPPAINSPLTTVSSCTALLSPVPREHQDDPSHRAMR